PKNPTQPIDRRVPNAKGCPPQTRRTPSKAQRLVAASDRDHAQNLDVQPDDGDHDAEAAHPAELAGSAVANTLLDLIEVENQRVGSHEDDEHAEDESERDAHDLSAAQA